MFRVNNSLLSSNPIGTFLKNMNIYDHNTRNKLDFHVIPRSLFVREYNITIYVVKCWNNLPEICKDIKIFNSFRSKIRC